jgi:hypothetical protein
LRAASPFVDGNLRARVDDDVLAPVQGDLHLRQTSHSVRAAGSFALADQLDHRRPHAPAGGCLKLRPIAARRNETSFATVIQRSLEAGVQMQEPALRKPLAERHERFER